MALDKKLYEGFANFFEQPTRENFRGLLQSNIGETDLIDFKESWPSLPKTAKHILALANSGGGCLVVGVSETDGNLESKGVTDFLDKADIQKGITKFLPERTEYEVLDFKYNASEYNALVGKSFQVLLVEHNPKYIPYLCLNNGDGIKSNVVYVRRGTSSTEANHDELERLINKRIDSGYSSTNILKIEEHLEQLKVLYSQINKYHMPALVIPMPVLNPFSKKNPAYPKEDYEAFISNLIIRKMKRIEQLLEV